MPVPDSWDLMLPYSCLAEGRRMKELFFQLWDTSLSLQSDWINSSHKGHQKNTTYWFPQTNQTHPQKQGMAFASLKHIIVWRHGCLEKKPGFCRDGGQGEDDRSMRDLSDATGRPSVCERQRVAGGTGQGCHTGPEEKRMLDRATGCCVQLWLRTFYFEDLFKILSRMEWFGILENLRKIKMLLNFKEN